MAVSATPMFQNMQNVPGNTDGALIAAIKQIFRTEGTEGARQASAIEAPSESVIDYALNSFSLIQNPAVKMDAFASVLWANNTTDDIAKQFYDALPTDMQNGFKFHIYVQNNSDDEGHGFEFGDHVVENRILENLSIQAARSYRDELCS
jgi:hypothetical protein